MAAETELEVRVRGKDELSPSLAQLESKIIRWVGAVSASLAAVKITTAPIIAAAQFERELANITKTAGFTGQELKTLSSELLEIGRRTDIATLDLAKIAAAAGQQGLGKFGVEGVVQFTESVARMSSTLDVTAEEAADNIGKIANIFKIPLREIENAVSTFNEVSNNSTANGRDLLDVVRRIGDAAGALDLQGATAFAATGLDFGQSAEVVGTAGAKIFSSLIERAEEFSKIMNVDSTAWIKTVQQDGIGALKSVLQEFRNFKPADQQKAIVKLFGGGRIGSLVNKLVQDTQNAVLERNIASAFEGQKGNSAIKEQETVLNTLVAQSKAALNSLFALAVGVSDQALSPLTKYVAQLNTALQSDGLKSFLSALVGSLLEVVEGLASAVKFVASLNVNWENFINVIRAFIGLKLAQYLGGTLVSSATKFGDSFRYIATGAVAAEAATKAAGAAAAGSAAQQVSADAQVKTSIASRILGYEELSKKSAAHKLALQAEKAAELEAAAARKAAAAAQAPAAVATGRNTAAQSQVQAASQAAIAQRQALAAAEQRAAQIAAQQQAALNARLAVAAQADAAVRLQIEQAYQTRLAAIKATGTRVGLTELKREQANQTAQADAFYERSIRSIQSYYARQAATAAAGAQSVVNAERLAYMQRVSALDGSLNKAAGTAAAVQAPTAALAAANAQLAATETRLTALQRATGLAGAAATSFGLIMRSVGAIVAAAGRLIASSFFWVTILYSVADAFGLLDGLGAKFQTLTDKIGLTSEAARKKAVEDEKTKQRLKDEAQAVQELIDKYSQYINAKTGAIQGGQLDAAAQLAKTSEDPGGQQQALASIAEFGRAIDAERTAIAQRVSTTNAALIESEKAKIVQYVNEVNRLSAQLNVPQLDFDAMGMPRAVDKTAEFATAIDALNKKIAESEKFIREQSDASEALTGKLEGLKKSSEEVGKVAAAMFTPESLAYANQTTLAYAEQGLQLIAAKKQYEELAQAAKGGEQPAVDAANAAKNALELLRAKQDETRLTMLKYIDDQIANGEKAKVSASVLASWEQLRIIINGASGDAATLIKSANAGVAAGAVPTGLGANSGKKSATSNPSGASFSGKKGNDESQARKEAKARLELERARIQAENNLKEEAARQELDRMTDVFDQGLILFQDYYDKRRAIQLQANQFDIDDKGRELKAVEDEVKLAKDKADKDKFETQAVKLRGQIKVLEEQRKSIDAQNAEELRRATESFRDRVASETTQLMGEGIIPATMQEAFTANLTDMLAEYRVFINQLRASGQNVLADALTASFSAQALGASLKPVTAEIESTFDTISRYASRLSIARNDGVITGQQAEAAYNETIRQQIPLLQARLDAQQATLQANEALRISAPMQYQALQDAVDNTRLKIEQLNSEMDKTAKDFNAKVTSSFSQALQNISTDGFKEAARKFALDIAQALQKSLTDTIAETAMQALDPTGKGGIGGWLQGVLQGGRGGVPAGVAADQVAAKGITLGATPANALYTRDADGLLNKGLLGGDKDEAGFESLIEKLSGNEGSGEIGALNAPTEGITKQLQSTFDELGESLTDVFSGLKDTLSDVFSGLGDLFSSAGGSGTSGWASLIVSLFHSGGRVGTGRGMSRAVNPAIFANAPRYHSGTAGAGMKPNEVPAILEKGETVRTAEQEAALAATQSAAAAAGQGGNTRIVNVLDPDLAKSYMEGAGGEKIIMNHIKGNAAGISQMLPR